MKLIFRLFWTWILQATQAVKINVKLDKKISSSNLIFQTQFFKNPVQMNRNNEQWFFQATYALICEDFNLITENCNAKFGAKVVRGAYLEKEKKLAKLNNYSDPINESYEATGEMYLKGFWTF